MKPTWKATILSALLAVAILPSVILSARHGTRRAKR